MDPSFCIYEKVRVGDHWLQEQSAERYKNGQRGDRALALATDAVPNTIDNVPDAGDERTLADGRKVRITTAQDYTLRSDLADGQALIITGNSAFPKERMKDFWMLEGNPNRSKVGNAQNGEGGKFYTFAVGGLNVMCLHASANWERGCGYMVLCGKLPAVSEDRVIDYKKLSPDHCVMGLDFYFDKKNPEGRLNLASHNGSVSSLPLSVQVAVTIITECAPTRLYDDYDGEQLINPETSTNALKEFLRQYLLRPLHKYHAAAYTMPCDRYNAKYYTDWMTVALHTNFTKVPHRVRGELVEPFGYAKAMTQHFVTPGTDVRKYPRDILCLESGMALSAAINRQWTPMFRKCFFFWADSDNDHTKGDSDGGVPPVEGEFVHTCNEFNIDGVPTVIFAPRPAQVEAMRHMLSQAEADDRLTTVRTKINDKGVMYDAEMNMTMHPRHAQYAGVIASRKSKWHYKLFNDDQLNAGTCVFSRQRGLTHNEVMAWDGACDKSQPVFDAKLTTLATIDSMREATSGRVLNWVTQLAVRCGCTWNGDGTLSSEDKQLMESIVEGGLETIYLMMLPKPQGTSKTGGVTDGDRNHFLALMGFDTVAELNSTLPLNPEKTMYRDGALEKIHQWSVREKLRFALEHHQRLRQV